MLLNILLILLDILQLRQIIVLKMVNVRQKKASISIRKPFFVFGDNGI